MKDPNFDIQLNESDSEGQAKLLDQIAFCISGYSCVAAGGGVLSVK